MSIRQKTFLITSLMLASLILTMYLFSKITLLKGFEQLEKKVLHETLKGR